MSSEGFFIIGARRAATTFDTWIWASDGTNFIEEGNATMEGVEFRFGEKDENCLALHFGLSMRVYAGPCPCGQRVLCEARFFSAETARLEQI